MCQKREASTQADKGEQPCYRNTGRGGVGMGCATSTPVSDVASSRAPQLHVLVTRPLTEHACGSVECVVVGDAAETYAWLDASGAVVGTQPSLEDAPAGTYTVRVTTAGGAHAEATTTLTGCFDDVVVVTGYRATACSSSYARDGGVEACGHNLDDERVRFLWTSGVVTNAPTLRDVPVGTYAVALVTRRADAPTPVLVHECAPAVVGTDARL